MPEQPPSSPVPIPPSTYEPEGDVVTTAQVTYNLSSIPPLTGLFGAEPVTLLVGLDEDGPDGALKVYLGARYKRVHLLVTAEAEKDSFRRAWGSGGHVWMWPVPPREALHVDPVPAAGGAS